MYYLVDDMVPIIYLFKLISPVSQEISVWNPYSVSTSTKIQ